MLMMKRPTPVTSVQVRPCEEPGLAQLRSVFMAHYAGCQVRLYKCTVHITGSVL